MNVSIALFELISMICFLLLLLLVVIDHFRLGCLIKRNFCQRVCDIYMCFTKKIIDFTFSSYLIIAPKLFKVDYDNQFSVFIAAASQPVDVKFELVLGAQRLEGKVVCKPGETRNATITLPKKFPIGAGELIITGTGGLQFEEKRDVIVYDSRHVLLVQTSASTYRPHDIMEVRVVATTEELMPMESGELTIEIYVSSIRRFVWFIRMKYFLIGCLS